jgi:hypothetical protein
MVTFVYAWDWIARLEWPRSLPATFAFRENPLGSRW